MYIEIVDLVIGIILFGWACVTSGLIIAWKGSEEREQLERNGK